MRRINNILGVLLFCSVLSATAWAENNPEVANDVKIDVCQPEEEVVLWDNTVTGNPLKKQMKQWQKIDQQDMTALSTEQAVALKTYLADAGEKQIKRGRILFWTGLAWPVLGGVLGGVTDSKVLIGVCGGLGVAQISWGLLDMMNGRTKIDNARKVIVSTPPPGYYGDDLQIQLNADASRWQANFIVGPTLSFSF